MMSRASLALVLVGFGCSQEVTIDAGLSDAQPKDAGSGDAESTVDAEQAPADATPGTDARIRDSGGHGDAEALDMGTRDLGTLDGGPSDADAEDAGLADATTRDSGPVVTHTRYFREVFSDDFRGKTGLPSDAYCFDTLKPQCHVWAGTSHDCDLVDVQGSGFFPPTRANLLAALKVLMPAAPLDTLDDGALKAAYGEVIGQRLASLDKCTWTLYDMVNWMATDYAGHWSARFDPTRVEVDPSGKGHLKLSAVAAPVEYDCIFGGTLAGPNCQIHEFGTGVVQPGVVYWVDPDPRWAGVYYAPTGSSCPHGGTFTGVNCSVFSFAPHVLEERGVSYWVDANPAYPGVYYANQTYACRDNIDYTPNLAFRNLTCPILNGAIMSHSFTNRPWVDESGVEHPRGRSQLRGRFEAKARIPRGVGAFPAAWLMPESGGWPYDGGEIDIMEARDAANEVYHTYHHGKCYSPATQQEIDATDGADCDRKGGSSLHISKGWTTQERAAGEFWTRDHLFAVEWVGDQLDFFLNNVHVGTIGVGTGGNLDPMGPMSLASFEASNFPTEPFYWILNHSTWVSAANVPTFAPQTFEIDYVKSYVLCGAEQTEYCPCGGAFEEGVGCRVGNAAMVCPPGVSVPEVTRGVYASPCRPSERRCVLGGRPAGNRCLVRELTGLVPGVAYWADADPRWPGVYYAKIGGACPHGGSGTVNCQVEALAGDVLETGVSYQVETSGTPGIYYTPDFDF